MNKLHMMLFASIATVISLSAAQKATTDNARAEKFAKFLHFGAENCDKISPVKEFVQLVERDAQDLTASQLKFAFNYEKDGKNPLAIARLKDCERCYPVVAMLEKGIAMSEAAELLGVDHLTIEQLRENYDLWNKMHMLSDGKAQK